MMKIIHKIFRLITTFHAQLTSDNWLIDGREASHPAFIDIQSTYRSFHQHSAFLFKGKLTAFPTSDCMHVFRYSNKYVPLVFKSKKLFSYLKMLSARTKIVSCAASDEIYIGKIHYATFHSRLTIIPLLYLCSF